MLDRLKIGNKNRKRLEMRFQIHYDVRWNFLQIFVIWEQGWANS